MHRIVEWVKEHPKAAGGILLGMIVLLFLVMRSGKAPAAQSTVVMAQPTDVAQNAALQAAQLNAQVQTNATLAAAGVQNNAIGAAEAVQSLQSNNATTVALENIAATADTTKYISNLQATVANNQTEAAKAINDSQMTAAQQIAAIDAQAGQAVAALQADSTNKQTAAAVTIAGLQQALGLAQNNTQYALGSQQINANYQLGSQQIAADSAYNLQHLADAAALANYKVYQTGANIIITSGNPNVQGTAQAGQAALGGIYI